MPTTPAPAQRSARGNTHHTRHMTRRAAAGDSHPQICRDKMLPGLDCNRSTKHSSQLYDTATGVRRSSGVQNPKPCLHQTSTTLNPACTP
jgi:hypothetical protein